MMKNRLLWFALLVSLPGAAAEGGKVAPDIDRKAASVDVIVQFAAPPSDQQIAAVQGKGGTLKSRLGSVKAAAYSIWGGAIDSVASLPGVKYVSPDRPVQGQLDYSAAAANATIAWKYGWSGKGIGIAVIDSGISQSTDLKVHGKGNARVVYSEAFGPSFHDAEDGYGHGTHVAGIAAGDGFGSSGKYEGIAPEANIINLRVLDDQGAGSDSAVLAAISRAIDLKDRYNIRVMNLSLGRGVFESYRQDPLCQAVEAAWKAGIVVVVAAGNGGRDNSYGREGYGTILAPGNDPYVITVGAMKANDTITRADDLIASYSSKGPTAIDHVVKPDLVAPGNRVVSNMGHGNHTLARMYPQNGVKADYFRLSGTSMATPVVSGAVALMVQQDPQLTPDQVKARLMRTATKSFPTTSLTTDPDTGITYRSVYDIFTVGAGYLDINAAMSDGQLASKPALSPTASFNAQTGTVSLVHDDSVVWGSTVVWGPSVVWGSSVVWGDSAVWGSSVVWGDTASMACSVVWGSAVLPAAGGAQRTSITGE